MLTIGALLVCSALLAFAALTLIFRRPEPPRWTRRSAVGEIVTIALVTLLTFGVGYLAAGAITAYRDGVGPIDLGFMVVVVVATVVAWRHLDVRRRLRAYAAADRANLATHADPALKLGTPAARPEQPAEPAHLHAA